MPASATTSLRDAAARLVEAGYRLVVTGRGKAPLVVAGHQEHGLRDATSDPDELDRRLDAAGPNATRLSVACGADGPVVLDGDGPCAASLVERIAAEAGAPIDRSPHGLHAFFGPDPTVRRRTRHPGDRLPGCDHPEACWVDVLAASAAGGPGSLCAVYRPDVLPPLLELPPLPTAALASVLPPPPAPRPALPAGSAGPRPAHPGALHHASPRAVLEHAVRAVETAPPGTRHDALLRYGRTVGGVVGDELSESEAIEALVAASIRSGHDALDAARTAADAVAMGIAAPLAAAPEREAEAPEPIVQRLGEFTLLDGLDAARRRLDEAVEAIAADTDAVRITLLRAGVGVGKTSIVAPELARRGIPLLCLVHNREAKRQLAAHLRKAGVTSYAVQEARHAAEEGEGPSTPGVCSQMSVVRDLGDHRHPPMTTACVTCVNGLAASVEQGRPGARSRLCEASWARGLPPDAIDPCGYILGNAEAKRAQAVIMTAHAYASSWLESPFGRRIVIIDEGVDLMGSGLVTVAEIGLWCTWLAEHIASVRAYDPIDAGLHQAFAHALADLSAALGRQAAEAPLAVAPSAEVRTALEAAIRAADPLLHEARKKSIVTAPWEAATVDWRSGKHHIPLRAIEDLGWALEHDALSVAGGALSFDAPTPLLRDIVAGKMRAIILDATPLPETIALVEHLGGQVVEAVPPQPVAVRVAAQRVHGRGHLDDHALEREAEKLAALAEADADIAVLTHKPIAERVRKLIRKRPPERSEELTGWWGRHDRSHDEWAGHDLLVVGLPLLAPAEEQRAWRRARALLRWVGVDWPEWTDERVAAEVEVVPGVVVPSPLHYSADETIRDWQLARQAGWVGQALGRVRALHHRGHIATLCGPPVPIAQHGFVDVVVLDDDPLGGARRRDVSRAQHADAMARCSAAAIALHEAGEPVTRARVQSWLRRRRLRAPSSQTWRRWRALYGRLGVTELRAALEQLRDELTSLGERGGARFQQWAASARQAASHVLGAAVALLPARRRLRRRSERRRSASRQAAGPIRAP